MKREVQPELLDTLPADDGRAIKSRRDLQKVNWWMGHAGLMSRLLDNTFRECPPRSLAELGAGDGTLLLRLATRLAPRWKPARVVLVDQQRLLSARTQSSFEALGWPVEIVKLDVFDWLQRPHPEPYDVFLANLFLHHFTDDALRLFLAQVAQQTDVFLACEPRRGNFALSATRLLWLLGCNSICVEDGKISVRAGFAGDELSALWPGGNDRPGLPNRGEWHLSERRAGLFSHCFLAQRTGQSQL